MSAVRDPLILPRQDDLNPHAECNGSDSSVLRCHKCDKQYERIDHLKRHLQSHENSRSHKCPSCPRRFNRSDLLHRHRASHHGQNNTHRRDSRRSDRAIQACQSCMLAKTKCEDNRPCKRCRDRKLQCVNGPANRRSALLSSADGSIDSIDQHSPESIPSPAQLISITEPGKDNAAPDMGTSGNSPSSSRYGRDPASLSMLPTLSAFQKTSTLDPNYDMELLDDSSWTNFVLHADLLQVYQDVDFQFDESLQSVNSESWPTIDTIAATHSPSLTTIRPSITQTMSQYDPLLPAPSSFAGPLSGYEAFKRSPWLWTPANQDHAYAEQSQLAVNEENIMAPHELAEGMQRCAKPLPELGKVASRDEILAMILKFTKSSFKIRAFPSLNLLNILMQAYFMRERSSSAPWIHEGTFDPDQCRTELLAGVIASGAMSFSASNIWKMGLALQEIVKLAICDSLDEDNRLARQLQSLQTFLLWIEVGLWSGFRRKMEIGEGFAHTVPTMLRRAGAFNNSHYLPAPQPDLSDSIELLRSKWHQWVEQQSFKRIVLKIFMNEMQSSIAFVRSPVFSGTELTFTLPASRELWENHTAEEWRDRYLARGYNERPVTITLQDAMHDISRLEVEAKSVDIMLSAQAVLYGYWGQIWTHLNSKMFYQRRNPQSSQSHRQAASLLWLEAQHQQLYQSIQSIRDGFLKMSILSPEIRLTSELLMMSLYACVEDVQRLAGRHGEEEMKTALPYLRHWANGSEALIATWHAGQVLGAARMFPPTQLRGFYAIAVYHACLTLWVFTVLSSRSPPPYPSISGLMVDSRLTEPCTFSALLQNEAIGESLNRDESNVCVLLDGDETPESRIYLTSGCGIPSLQLGDEKKDLRDASVIPTVMTHIFRANYPAKSDPFPPLLENLVTLMTDLSKAGI